MTIFTSTHPAVYGLAFDVEKDPDRKSGFRPAPIDLGAQLDLFADIRLDGFAALLQLGFAEKLIIVGGIEGRYKNENIPRGRAIYEMLRKDHGIPSERLKYGISVSNTGGNVELIRRLAGGVAPTVISNHYHLPRAAMDFAGMNATLLAAESFLLLAGADRHALVERLGGGAFAERVVAECQGISDKLRGTYMPRTNVQPKRRFRRLFG